MIDFSELDSERQPLKPTGEKDSGGLFQGVDLWHFPPFGSWDERVSLLESDSGFVEGISLENCRLALQAEEE
ncbi:hypothetical protein NDU88_001183 [Pleurodeles waltl]|uniref:Uncharacterized protein n=1 Tax=Pleurodeles waltl TaxID=8319 RepID=A0AAV7U7P9_PLEWA|nr:hypothetical protein NDU88_001183 [Pleurodeles waltl]